MADHQDSHVSCQFSWCGYSESAGLQTSVGNVYLRCPLPVISRSFSNGTARSGTLPRWRRTQVHTFASSRHREAWGNWSRVHKSNAIRQAGWRETALLFICRRYFTLYNKLVQDYSSGFCMILPMTDKLAEPGEAVTTGSWTSLQTEHGCDVWRGSFVRASGLIWSVLLWSIDSTEACMRLTETWIWVSIP